MNRRSILSTLCTGALALLAPVAAWAKPRRWVGFHNRGIKPMVITPREFRCISWSSGSFDPRNRMNDASGTGRYIAALERIATAAARIYNEGSVLSDAGRPTARFVRRNSIDASLELEASICDLRDGYHFSFEAQKQAVSPASDVAELRALLAEARDLLTPIVPFKRKDGTLANFTQVHADDITGFVRRADAALKGHEHA